MNLSRPAAATVNFIDQYCEAYQEIFPEVRSFECFKWLHLGMISEIKRKTLPAIAKAVGINNAQQLHHFLSKSPWSVEDLRKKRMEMLLKALGEAKFILVIDETGDRKKGKTTDYVERQYIGNLGKIDNGIVSVNAYRVIENISFPLMFKIFKPKKRLKEEDSYQTKIELARKIIEELVEWGFQFEIVLADSFYGESSQFRRIVEKYNLKYVVAIRQNHVVWMPSHEKVRRTRWQKFNRIFSNEKLEIRYIREIIFGHKSYLRYWEITTDKVFLPPNSTWFLMTNLEGNIQKTVGNIYGLRTWIEYGFKQCKDELGWADYRLTSYAEIEKWWEIVMSAYLMVSFQSKVFLNLSSSSKVINSQALLAQFQEHPWWNHAQGWKNNLNNLRLVIQPMVFCCLITPWLSVFPIPSLTQGFCRLIDLMNQFNAYVPDG